MSVSPINQGAIPTPPFSLGSPSSQKNLATSAASTATASAGSSPSPLEQIFQGLETTLGHAAVNTTLGKVFSYIKTNYTGSDPNQAAAGVSVLSNFISILQLANPDAPGGGMPLGQALQQVLGTSGPATELTVPPETIRNVIGILQTIQIRLPPQRCISSDGTWCPTDPTATTPQTFSLWSLATSTQPVQMAFNIEWFQKNQANKTGFTWPSQGPQSTLMKGTDPMHVDYHQETSQSGPGRNSYLYFPQLPGLAVQWVNSQDGADTHNAAMSGDADPDGRTSAVAKWHDAWNTNSDDPLNVETRVTMPANSLAYACLWQSGAFNYLTAQL